MNGMWRVFLSEAWRGKSIGRTWMNLKIRQILTLSGRVLDLGGGQSPSYYRFLGYNAPPSEVIRLDINPAHCPHLVASLESGIPLRDNSVYQVFLFNVLEHVFHHQRLVFEMFRVLDQGGKVYLWVPFLAAIHADPDDYYRYTHSTLYKLLTQVGFEICEIEPCSGLPMVVADMLRSIVPTRFLRTLWTLGALAGEWLLNRLAPNFNQRFVLGYFCVARK